MQVDRRHQRIGQQRQRRCGGHAKQQAKAQAPVQGGAERLRLLGLMQTRQVRQQDGTQRDGDDADRQFHQAVGVVKPRATARFQVRSQQHADEGVDLPGGSGQDSWHQQLTDFLRTRVTPVRPRRHQQAQAFERRHLQRQLNHASGQHAPRQRIDRCAVGRHRPQRGANQRDVQQHRREGWHGVAVRGVQHRTGKRRQRDQAEVGEDDAREVHRQRELRRIVREALHERRHQSGSTGNASRRDQQQDEAEVAGHRRDESLEREAVLMAGVFRQHRHERLRESTLREQAPEEIGQRETEVERIGRAARADDVRENDVAQQSRHARRAGQAGHRGALRRYVAGRRREVVVRRRLVGHSKSSNQCSTGTSKASAKCVWQPTLAVATTSGPCRASSCALRRFNSLPSSGCSRL